MKAIFLIMVVTFTFAFSESHSQRRVKSDSISNYFSINNEDNILKYKFSFENDDLVWSKIFVSNNKVSIPYCLKKSRDTIHTYSSDLSFRRWTKESNKVDHNSDGEYISSIYTNTLYGAKTYPIYIFYGDSTLYCSYLENSRSEWINNNKLFTTLGTENSVIGVISPNIERSYTFVNTKDKNGVNSVVKVMSNNNGFTWSTATIAVKHNTQELKGWCVSSHTDKPMVSYMILSDKNNMPYCSITEDGGVTWSYPKRISNSLRGDSFNCVVDGGYFVVSFRKITDNGEGEHNDMIIWHGTQQEFMGENKKGNTMKVADNKSNDKVLEFSIEDIIYYKNRQYFVLIKSKQEGETALQIHLIRRTKTK